MKHDILKFLPLLALYLFFVFMFSSTTFVGDEGGYVKYASLLSHGYEFLNGEATLWWGPGYPIVLVPFALLQLPWLAAKLLNAFFLFGSIIYFYKTMNLYIENKYATIVTLFLGLYPPLMREVHLLITESLVFFLVCGFLYHFCRLHRELENSWFHLLVSSIYMGYLALTKIFFGYVILAGLLSFLAFFLWRRTDSAKKTTLIYLIALILCIPYLLYTYSRTGKIFYWGTSGGMSLYWMSTSYNANELGSWFSLKNVQDFPELAPHKDFFNKITSLPETAMDDAFKEQAIENITHYPVKYFGNWAANIGRLLFSYPFSYTNQKISTYFYILPNMFIVVLFLLGVYPAISRRKIIPFEIYALLLFALITFGGASLVSAYDRQFRPLIPILLLWLSFVYLRILKIEMVSDVEIS